MNKKVVYLDDWRIFQSVDDDGHLTVAIEHGDGTKVRRLNMDIEVGDKEWSDRFTTEDIERYAKKG